MQAATSDDGLTIINFGMGSPNAATIMDLLIARRPEGVLFLGKCGGLKGSSEIGHFILPIAAIRGEGTSDDYFPPEVPALPSFKLHKFVSEKIVEPFQLGWCHFGHSGICLFHSPPPFSLTSPAPRCQGHSPESWSPVYAYEH